MNNTVRRGLPLWLTLAVLCMSAAGAVTGLVGVRGHDIVRADGTKIALKGISLGNWLVPEGYMFGFKHAIAPRQMRDAFSELVGPDDARAFWRQWRDSFITRDDIMYLKQIGCNSLRLPFTYKLFVLDDRPEIWLEDGFAPLDRVVGWAREAGLWVILDMHVAPGGQTGENIDDSFANAWLFESEESQARMAMVWKRIAAHFRGEPTVLGYELLNEPIAHYTDMKRYNPRLEPLYKRVTAAIREVDTSHLILLGGAQWNLNFDVFGRPFDDRLIYTFHRYWCKTDESEVKSYLAFRAKYDVPIWLGESGENNDDWVRAFRGMLDRNDIGWCFWTYKKLDATSCIASYARPRYWNEVVRYVDTVNDGDFEGRCRTRPPLRHAREALQGLLENTRLSRCRINQGFIRALGLTP